MSRKIKQISSFGVPPSADMSTNGYCALFALCEDNTLWLMDSSAWNKKWEQILPIPELSSESL